MQAPARPLSPHLQIYRWYLTMGLSIAHRVSGAALVGGLFLLVWWLGALASGPEAYATVSWVYGSILGKLVLLGFTVALAYHTANGVRHLVWDAGYGFDIKVARQSGLAVIAATAALTVLVWLAVILVR